MPTKDFIQNNIIHVPRRFVSTEWGGTESVIFEISRCQQRAGMHPSIHTSMALASRFQEEMEGIPVERYSHCYPWFGLTSGQIRALDKKGGNLLSLNLMFGLLKAPPPRLYHAHALKRMGGIVRTIAKIRSRPYVVTIHGGVNDVPRFELDRMLAPVRGKLEWGKAFGAMLGSRKVLEDADHVICVGESEYISLKAVLNHDRISYLPNGVSPEKFENGIGSVFRHANGVRPDSHLIGNISRIDAQKNQALLIKAFIRFQDQNKNSELVLIGPVTEESYHATLSRLISQSPCTERIHLLEAIHPLSPMLKHAYDAIDTFVLPSIHEPFGIVVLEAWAAGKPVIASRTGGLKHLIENEVNGIFFDTDSSRPEIDLAQLMHRIHVDSRLAEKIAESGHSNACENFGWPRITADLEQIYQTAEEHFQKKQVTSSTSTGFFRALIGLS